jgi:hypothetical protein
MDVFTAWASLEFLVVATVALISLWRAMIYIWDITEATAEKAANYVEKEFKGGN